jgi:HlyD family secretion protein
LPRVAAALALVAAGGACRRAHDPALSVAASGHVEATEVHVSTKVAGRLEALRVGEGDPVTAGQELGRVDTVDLELARRQARAELAQAQADLRLRLAGARAEDIAEVEAQARSAEADLEAARRDLERLEALLDRGSGTAKARDDARTRRDVARARWDALQQSLRRLRAGFRVEEKDAARARVASVEARLAQLDQQLADAVIRSPRAGVVTEKIAEAGELLQVGAPVVVVTDLADVWLRVYVGEPDLARIRLGQTAEVVTDDGQRRHGKIIYVASKAEFTPRNVQTRDERVKLVYEVKVGLDNADGLFKPGMPAEALLPVAGAGAAAPPAGSAPADAR